jgi:hypothetical protein
MSLIHPAFTAIEVTERCWSRTDEQASERARIVLSHLVAMGLVTGGFWQGGRYCIAREDFATWQRELRNRDDPT